MRHFANVAVSLPLLLASTTLSAGILPTSITIDAALPGGGDSLAWIVNNYGVLAFTGDRAPASPALRGMAPPTRGC